MSSTCVWPDCNKAANRLIDGQGYCDDHYRPRLLALVIEGIEQGIDAKGHCRSVIGWPNRFARLVSKDDTSSIGGLSKAKIERRGYDFQKEDGCVLFSIDRHPAGREQFQRWRYDLNMDTLELLEERILNAEFATDANGEGVCPKCRKRLILTPGRVSCSWCSFEIQHDHSLYPEGR